jgi:hypothetical protein
MSKPRIKSRSKSRSKPQRKPRRKSRSKPQRKPRRKSRSKPQRKSRSKSRSKPRFGGTSALPPQSTIFKWAVSDEKPEQNPWSSAKAEIDRAARKTTKQQETKEEKSNREEMEKAAIDRKKCLQEEIKQRDEAALEDAAKVNEMDKWRASHNGYEHQILSSQQTPNMWTSTAMITEESPCESTNSIGKLDRRQNRKKKREKKRTERKEESKKLKNATEYTITKQIEIYAQLIDIESRGESPDSSIKINRELLRLQLNLEKIRRDIINNKLICSDEHVANESINKYFNTVRRNIEKDYNDKNAGEYYDFKQKHEEFINNPNYENLINKWEDIEKNAGAALNEWLGPLPTPPPPSAYSAPQAPPPPSAYSAHSAHQEPSAAPSRSAPSAHSAHSVYNPSAANSGQHNLASTIGVESPQSHNK